MNIWYLEFKLIYLTFYEKQSLSRFLNWVDLKRIDWCSWCVSAWCCLYLVPQQSCYPGTGLCTARTALQPRDHLPLNLRQPTRARPSPSRPIAVQLSFNTRKCCAFSLNYFNFYNIIEPNLVYITTTNKKPGFLYTSILMQ